MIKEEVKVLAGQWTVKLVVANKLEVIKYVSENVHGWTHVKAMEFFNNSIGGAFDDHEDETIHIVIDEDPWEEALPVMVHELVHVSQMMASRLLVKDENGEFEAYLVSGLFREFYPIISNNGKA